jgi:DNA-binding Xre family transcriptional regulator
MDEISLSRHLATQVRLLIAVRGLKKKALAPALGITEDQAYARISGRVRFELDELPALAAFLDCEVSDLLLTDRTAA